MLLPCLRAVGLHVITERPEPHSRLNLVICEDGVCEQTLAAGVPILVLGWQQPDGFISDHRQAFLCKAALAERVLLKTVEGLLGQNTAPVKAASANLSAETHYAGKVLVAEDNLINQRVVSAYLTKLGCEVVLVETGLAAVKVANEQAFDLVLMDWQMPEMDGLTATRILRSHANTRFLPIIALTANAFEHSENECLAAGMDGFLAKPLDLMKLKAVVAQYLPEQSLVCVL
jgi:CheY-like chemotaxis protein